MAVSSTFVAADGDGYELQMGRWSRRLAPLFIDFAGITDAKCVLDVGCGTGNLSFGLARNPEIGGCAVSIFHRYMSSTPSAKTRMPVSTFRWETLAPCIC